MTEFAQKVTINSVSKIFSTLRGVVPVLKQIDLTIEPGEFFVLLGPSGCGKSTLLNCIAGLETPSSGAIHIGEKTVFDKDSGMYVEPFHRDVSMVFQSYALYPHFTVEKNIAFPLTNIRPRLGKEEIGHRVRETAELLQISELLDRKPKELSGGQRQRVAIGRAIVRKPSLFLMDEPLSNLDARLRMDMRARLKALQHTLGVTVVYVTHDQLEAMTLGTRIAVLHDGVIQQVDKPELIYDNPVNPFVARFIGAPAMNLFVGDIISEDDTLLLRNEYGSLTIPDHLREKIDNTKGRQKTLGVRPHDFTFVDEGQGNMDVTISVVENIGGEFLSYIFMGEEQIVVKSQRKPPAMQTGLSIAAGKGHVFN